MHVRLALIAFLALGCSAATESASEDPTADARLDPIVHGKADTGDPAVVAIDIGGHGLCTGSLVGPRWVLTARHCVSETAEAIDCASPVPQILSDRDPGSLTILLGKDVATAKPVAMGDELFVPPGDELCEHDIALIRLDRVVKGVKPLALGTASEPAVGSEIRAVGFGKRGDKLGAGKKYQRDHVLVLARSSHEFLVGESTCNGDSGGPALDALGRVVGVVSRGGPACSGPTATNVYTRTSAFPTLLAKAKSP